jgi:hypothetical protein
MTALLAQKGVTLEKMTPSEIEKEKQRIEEEAH